MKITDEVVANTRAAIHEHLKLLADSQSQRVYERDVLHANVPAELVCGWFDDAYRPDSPAFLAAFRPQEIEALIVFSDLFEAALAELPEPLPPLGDLQALPEWVRVTDAATHLLASLFDRSS